MNMMVVNKEKVSPQRRRGRRVFYCLPTAKLINRFYLRPLRLCGYTFSLFTTIMFIAEDLPQFKKLFVSKLKSMLTDDELGAFILVLANSQQDAYLKKELEVDLKNIFAVLKDNFIAGKLKATPDDSDVFQQLLDIAPEDIPVWQYKKSGDWEIACNSLRKLRPARASTQVLKSVRQEFDETKFHFNKPFLAPEILWQGEYQNSSVRVLYNKFPFSDYHLLIVISPEKNFSQILTQEMHQAVFIMVKDIEARFPGFGIGFNSLAAGASVNHLHFQGFVREQKFPVEMAHWSHNGGEKEYPLQVKSFADETSSWNYIEQLIGQNKAFNCLYRNDRCYVMPRKFQGTVDLPNWLAGAGWLDVAGVVTVSDIDTFNVIDEKAVSQALALLK
jgi:diadenosine tetraphosphate (Ap4A) HIT family hydrolase